MKKVISDQGFQRELSKSSPGDDLFQSNSDAYLAASCNQQETRKDKKTEKKTNTHTTRRAYCSTILYIRPRKTMELFWKSNYESIFIAE